MTTKPKFVKTTRHRSFLAPSAVISEVEQACALRGLVIIGRQSLGDSIKVTLKNAISRNTIEDILSQYNSNIINSPHNSSGEILTPIDLTGINRVWIEKCIKYVGRKDMPTIYKKLIALTYLLNSIQGVDEVDSATIVKLNTEKNIIDIQIQISKYEDKLNQLRSYLSCILK